jgi:hypothetical protein
MGKGSKKQMKQTQSKKITSVDPSVRQSLAAFSITLTPSANGKAFVVDLQAEPWCAEQAERYADFIGYMLTEHPDRPTIRNA